MCPREGNRTGTLMMSLGAVTLSLTWFLVLVCLLLTCAGISVVLDLTPNYQGSRGPWFSDSVTNVAERLKVNGDRRRKE